MTIHLSFLSTQLSKLQLLPQRLDCRSRRRRDRESNGRQVNTSYGKHYFSYPPKGIHGKSTSYQDGSRRHPLRWVQVRGRTIDGGLHVLAWLDIHPYEQKWKIKVFEKWLDLKLCLRLPTYSLHLHWSNAFDICVGRDQVICSSFTRVKERELELVQKE